MAAAANDTDSDIQDRTPAAAYGARLQRRHQPLLFESLIFPVCVDAAPMQIFLQGVACSAEGELADFQTTTRGAAPTDPPESVFRLIQRQEYRRAVRKHYGPTWIHRAYTATMIHGLHYWPDYGQRYELHYGPRYISSCTAIHYGPTTATVLLHC